MNEVLRTTILIVGGVFSILNVVLVMRKRMTERSTIVWLFGSVFIFILAAIPQSLNHVAHWLGIDYPPALLFLVSTLVLFVLALYQFMLISMLNEKVKELAQVVALVKYLPTGAGQVQPMVLMESAVGREKEGLED